MTRKHIHLLFVCWLAYATVPVINYIGVFNGIYVMLCATKGVMIHDASPQVTDNHSGHHQTVPQHTNHQQTLQETDRHLNHHAHHLSSNDASFSEVSADDHEAEKCPCIHFSFDTALALASHKKLEKALQTIVDTIHVSPITVIYAAQARGPPSISSFVHNNSKIVT